MKRSALLRRTPLRTRSQLRSRPKRVDRTDPARIEWKIVHAGPCDCGCHRFSMHLDHHHVVSQQEIKREGREDMLWDPRNGMYLHPLCHERHTRAMRRIPLERVSGAALAFAVDLLGVERAALYVARHYGRERQAA